MHDIGISSKLNHPPSNTKIPPAPRPTKVPKFVPKFRSLPIIRIINIIRASISINCVKKKKEKEKKPRSIENLSKSPSELQFYPKNILLLSDIASCHAYHSAYRIYITLPFIFFNCFAKSPPGIYPEDLHLYTASINPPPTISFLPDQTISQTTKPAQVYTHHDSASYERENEIRSRYPTTVGKQSMKKKKTTEKKANPFNTKLKKHGIRMRKQTEVQ
ncbi:hypothetical protein L873DRAFT_568026 [Choiromyces venosus 120613-1]|uniref:Uncharacterized protein n=1 Tax=Choiromyces venosus 120613-1 TaxID=1336337 RepID=A0A3N4JUU1_9PEZI|nr:hypothetical protein L873DRAFT_568026 [Choiromyces venosus 120613-1]